MLYSDAGMWNNSFNLVEGISDDSVQDLIQWLKLRDGEGSKLEYINFIKENKDLDKKWREIYERTKISLAQKHLLLDAVLIRDVTLPKTLQDAIENKLKQEQMSLEYEFKIEQAEKEAQRQVIEAEGKAKAKAKTKASSQCNTGKNLRYL